MDMNSPVSTIDKVSLLMINSNQSRNVGLAPIRFEAMNGVYTKILFDVTGRITIREYLSKRVTQEAFKAMLINLIETIENFDEFMISADQVILDINSVFINEVDNSVSFICVPIVDHHCGGKLYEFFKAVVDASYVDWNVNETSYFNGVYNVVKSENGFSLRNMISAMEMASAGSKTQERHSDKRSAPEPEEQARKRVEEPSEITVSGEKTYTPPVIPVMVEEEEEKSLLGKLFSGGKKKEKTKKPKEKPGRGYSAGLAGLKKGLPGAAEPHEAPLPQEQRPAPVRPEQKDFEYGGTTVLNGGMVNRSVSSQEDPKDTVQKDSYIETTSLKDNASEIPETTALAGRSEETTVLKKTPTERAYLIRKKDRKNIEITKPVFQIGREASEVDYCITDNTAVGRRHARVIKREDVYYLIDMRSRNHTYVNGEMLSPDTERQIFSGDSIMFADEEFEFRSVVS
ncbi:MAG: FHA domain-containing protein [Ruminococcus sp.]|nr:FHA domain-containing protein [Ruminococcus sp.]